MSDVTPSLKVAIGGDEAAYDLKEILIGYIRELGYEVEDFGTFNAQPVLYPDIAFEVATAIKEGRFDRAVLVCGTGIGVAISANKVSGIRAAQAHDTYSAAKARTSNNAQIVTLGARVIGPELAKSIVATFLGSNFSGGNSELKIAKIDEYEARLNTR
ncbi:MULTISPECIES: RpiB/LacA/LacB family sugar-phosphate isomerase [Halomonadaceae]|jgi:ribose 5-phosphate isomerase B|uniref:Ribose-5-phosphate isomerase n=1 Tax=Vreelandella aquamarina TaxID=77097 RepID=A0A1N6D9L5_9GAMM|nr:MULTISPECIES: RpiB/LacA/LacB family sugar-phosphate isomerase [Halomonas]MCP1305296.1 RpiB/LacA/LacB family sugar-phosphate isomerase [Halomonas sp. R1t8]MCP1329392.1 RpiB/LacA/LacB family sugar-phosphate isomerase [Halomonas sp. R1t4]SIN61780.1 ribose-5-phosphate isomerase [Halomonas meridiana]SIN67490.1 ribose-5-phosphate isomerase [Halomonas meridiana]SIN94247.1 ribose-5-phosphate isomerase [Halomonas meridiana]|tara:strand:+ start:449 stop:922 length:474 start_codon:yes stop_codon:yes gene_type:complete